MQKERPDPIRTDPNRTANRTDQKKDTQKLILQLGAAVLPQAFRVEPWKTVQHAPGLAAWTQLRALEAESVDGLYADQQLVLVPMPDVPDALAACWRLLKPGGSAWFVVPDLQALAPRLAQGMLAMASDAVGEVPAIDAVHLLWGSSSVVRRSGFVPDLLKRLLQQAGFQDVSIQCNAARCEMMATARKPVSMLPDSAQACFDLGRQLQAKGRMAEAARHYRRALEINPQLWPARYEYGVVSYGLGQLDDAISHVQQALQLEPRFALAHAALGSFLGMAGRHREAVKSLQRAADLDPKSAENHYNLGKAHQELNALADAEDAYRRALKLDPQMGLAMMNLGKVLNEQSHLTEGMALYRAAASRLSDPHLSSNWPTLLNYVDGVGDAELHAAHTQYDQRWLRPLMPAQRPQRLAGPPQRKLRLAYLSRDLRQHSVRYFLLPILRHHDRQKFEVTAYCDNRYRDAATAEFQRFCDHWVECADMDDAALADRVRKDGIDVLVDLAGHTVLHRLGVFARQPAPVQVTYLGYPATTGVSAIDWRVSDCHIDPQPGEGPVIATSEQPLRLQHGYFCYEPMADSPEVGPCPVEKRGYVTFGSLNQGSKLTPQLLQAWASLLQALPSARLCLQNAAGHERRAQDRMRATFKGLGVDPRRLDFKPFIPAPAYLRSYQEIDIALDSYPFNGGTTTCEALWMGAPVVSWAGTRHVARLGASILHQVGLQDLLAEDAQTYVQKALALAGAPERLRQLRAGMRERLRQSPLMDHAGFTAELEAELLRIWGEGAALSGSS